MATQAPQSQTSSDAGVQTPVAQTSQWQTPVAQTPQWQTPDMPAPQVQTPGMQPLQTPGMKSSQDASAQAACARLSKRTRIVIISAVVAVLVVAIGIAGYFLYQNAQEKAAEQAAYEAAHAMHAIVFKVDAAGYADSSASKIPVHVAGTDLDGAAVDEDAFVDAEGTGLELAQGIYVVNVVVSPLTSDGTVYDVPTTEWSVSIGGDVEPDASIDATAQPIALTPVTDYTTVPDETLAKIYEYAGRSGADQGTIDAYKSATDSRVQAAKDQKAAEEAAAAAEAQRKAEEEAIIKSTGIFDVESFMANPSRVPQNMNAKGFSEIYETWNPAETHLNAGCPYYKLTGSCAGLPSNTATAEIYYFDDQAEAKPDTQFSISSDDMENGAAINAVYYHVKGTGSIDTSSTAMRSMLGISDTDYLASYTQAHRTAMLGSGVVGGKSVYWAFNAYSYTGSWNLDYCVITKELFESRQVNNTESELISYFKNAGSMSCVIAMPLNCS